MTLLDEVIPSGRSESDPQVDPEEFLREQLEIFRAQFPEDLTVEEISFLDKEFRLAIQPPLRRLHKGTIAIEEATDESEQIISDLHDHFMNEVYENWNAHNIVVDVRGDAQACLRHIEGEIA